ncbi:MAG: hypothetical protein HY717_19615 [Planctomycetes bacterium]|nr:hypothetical protein [Planctomycetota bacterium]
MVTSKVFSSLEDKATQIERDNPGDPVALTNAIKVWKQYESLWNVADNKSPICKSRAEEIERSIKRMMEKQEKDLIQQKETQELSAAIDGLVRDCKQVETLCKEISDRYSLCAQRLANKILMAKRHHEEFLGKLKAWKGPLVRSHPIGDVPPQTKCVTIADLQDLIQQCCAETSSKIPDIQKLAVIEKEGAFREEVMGFDSEKLSHMVSPFIQAQNKIALDGDIIIRDLAVDLELVKNKCFLDRHKSDF